MTGQNHDPIVDALDAAELVDMVAIPAPSSPSREPEDADPPDDPDDETAEPRPLGFDVEKLNSEFSLVLLGSKAVVFLEQPAAPIEDQKRMLSLDAFAAWFSNRVTEVRGPDGKVKRITWAKRWMADRRRRQYLGVEFHPDPNNEPGTPGYLNLWSGFAVTPAPQPDPKRYAIFRDHLLQNICNGDPHRFAWVFGFFAHMVQRPRERIGTALVLRGKMGSGKSKIGDVFGSLFPRHYFPVDDPRYVTGNFNAHMASCILLQADEAVWAGDKSAEGRLKGLVTSSIQQIEAKGIDPIRLPNFLRVLMTSNEDWVVPAGKDERRFCVLDVNPRCAKNHTYFKELDEELANGGLQHLLADLLAFNLDSVNLRQILHTEALLEQKIRSLDSVESWWFERLWSGSLSSSGEPWPAEVESSVLFADYLAVAERIGVRRKQEEIVFGIKLGKLLPGLIRRRSRRIKFDNGISNVERPWCYILPPLDEAREIFESLLEQPVAWPPLEDESSPC